MFFKKYVSSFFTVIFVYCICYCESGANGAYEANIIGFSSPGDENVFLRNGDNSMLSFHNETQWSDDANECKCKNGRCENVCVDEVCRRRKQVCVCDPEFGKYDDETCIYCNCGKGFNCTIDRNNRGDMRKCVCPEGYYDYSGECALFCSESRPCHNGGTCKNGQCQCMSGTHGPFCKRIFWCAYECRPRLTVDCVYNQKEETYGCLCKNRSLVFDYKEWICKPCPCGEGTCKEERHELKCDCKSGYLDFQGQCKKCSCGSDHGCDLHWRTGEKICKCRKGYFYREGTCQSCNCGSKAVSCSLDNNGRKVCDCQEGYKDNFGLCERKKGTCNCHDTAKCIESDGGFTCECEAGYEGQIHDPPLPEEACIDIDECLSSSFCPQYQNQKCVNFPGSFMCQCKAGYQPVGRPDQFGKITCKEYKVSWVPAGITIAVVIAIIAVSVGLIIYLKKRETSRTPEIELRRNR